MTMKKITLALLLALIAMASHAQTFTNGNYTFEVTGDGTAKCTGLSSAGANLTSLEIPGYAFNNWTYYKVRAIKNLAFYGNTKITSVRILPGVETIEDNAFSSCSNLSVVSLPSTVNSLGKYVFSGDPIRLINCAAETMPSFNTYTFTNMSSVSVTRQWWVATYKGQRAANANSTITGQFSVSRQPGSAYDILVRHGDSGKECDIYAIVTNPWDPTTQSGGECKITYAVPCSDNSTKTLMIKYNDDFTETNFDRYAPVEIGDSAFMNTSQIKVLDLSAVLNFQKIGGGAFQGCTSLTSVILSAKEIGTRAFEYCSNLTSVRLYGTNEDYYSVQKLGSYCFASTGVSSVYIPKGLTTYNEGAFSYCSNLSSFSVSSSNNYFATHSFTPGCLYSKDKTTLCQAGGAFNDIYFDTNAPFEMIYIMGYAFAGNTSQVFLAVPYGVTHLGGQAFADMESLQSLSIPSSVTTFDYGVFQKLTRLTEFSFNFREIPAGLYNTSTFASLKPGCKLKVPKGCVSVYQNTSAWSSKFTGGISEGSCDMWGTYNNNMMYYTVTSAEPYLDTKVSSTATNGQLIMVDGGYNGISLSGAVTFPNTVTYRGKVYTITEIERELFRNHTAISSVSGGAGIKKIGALAFYGLTNCRGGFNIPYPVEFGDSALYNCKTPTIALGDRLERIGNDAFRNSGVKQVIMPNTVTEIGSRFIAGASELDSLKLSTGIKHIPYQGLAFCHAQYIVLPYGVETIDNFFIQTDNQDAFGINDSWVNHDQVVVIPSSVTYINDYAFKWARYLMEIYLNVPYGVFVTERAFWNRRSALDASNTYDWGGHKLYVPMGYLRHYRNDPGIQACWDEDDDVQYGAFDFTINNDFVNTGYRMTVIDPEAKTAKYVFNRGNVSTLSISGSKLDHNSGINYKMVEVEDSCWADHTALTTVSFSSTNTITRIGDHAFRGCTNLAGEVSIPTSVTEIGRFAFWNCNRLTSVFLNSTGNTTVGNYLFNPNDGTILYVPLSKLYDIAGQTSSWLSNMASNRLLLPYIKPTTEWSAISVPVQDNILLPASGEFYIAPSIDFDNRSLRKQRVSNDKGIMGYVGMLFKGSVGTVYRFRQITDVPNYTVTSIDQNWLNGVTGASQVLKSSLQGIWNYTFDGEKFKKATSNVTVYSGESYLVLTAAGTGLPAGPASIYITENYETYGVYINGVQVTEANCGDLSVIDGVSGTVSYEPSTKTLTLRNATIMATGDNDAILTYGDDAATTIVYNGTCAVTSPNKAGIWSGTNLTIQGGVLNPKKLTVAAANQGIYVAGLLNIIDGGTIETQGTYGISHNNQKLVVSGAYTVLKAKGSNASISGADTIELLDGLAITEPAGAQISNGSVVGSNGSFITAWVTISKPSFIRGDVNGDSEVNITDAIALINYVSTGNATGINMQAADCSQDNNVNISDAIALINFLLSGSW